MFVARDHHRRVAAPTGIHQLQKIAWAKLMIAIKRQVVMTMLVLQGLSEACNDRARIFNKDPTKTALRRYR